MCFRNGLALMKYVKGAVQTVVKESNPSIVNTDYRAHNLHTVQSNKWSQMQYAYDIN